VDLLDFLRPRLAHFMLPRYIRVLENLPRTPTQKVEKHVLRSAGISDDTWDRERAGIRVAREKIRG
jgi:crotonobetaine/carnitine-CoA ligase